MESDAQSWQVEKVVTTQGTFTDNVDLSRNKVSDFVLQITPTISLVERGAHTTFGGTISLPILLYARTDENNAVRPEVHLSGTAELYPRLVFVEASAQVSQEYLSPFGARPQNLVNATDNRLTTQSYRISPYVKGEAGGGLHYELRNNNVWTRANGASTLSDNAYTNEVLANIVSDPRPLGWGANFDRVDTRFSQLDSLLTQIGRLQGLWTPDPQWQVSVTGGYEDNRYPLQRFEGSTYGGGFKWRPTERTNVEASYEHRFFGASYHVAFDQRTPLTSWSISAFRDITSYPQQLANLSTGGDVNVLLNSLFASRVPDPLQRQTLVDQLIRERGLPSVLSGPLSLFSQQITLQESVRATAGLLGVRNSILLTAFRARSEPIAGEIAAITDGLLAQNDNTQTGANVVWAYRLTPLYTLATSAEWLRTVANDTSGAKSRQGTLQTVLSAPISVLTSIFAGARIQRLTSNFQDEVREAAVFAGITHIFR